MLREGMFIADRYEILERIGTGGMADVYKAKCHKLNRLVAIKVLKPEYCEDKTFVSKFRIEAQSAAGLMHSNIVNVYDVGEEDGIYYIIMELVEGITLKKYIEKKGHLGVREAVSVAIQVAQGIEAAHKHHIVHRDIKPQNIIISKEGKVKVTDFGIARAASANTINSSVMGSVHYISPEQARGGYSDEKSDIYSFGITLFEMLTGRVPFEGDSTVNVALQHIQEDMVSPKQYVDDIPISVEQIVLKCTQKKTDRRYQNMTELIADLKRSLVTPDENFVVISSVVPAGATQMINPEEMDEINKKASLKNAEIDVMDAERQENTADSYHEPTEEDSEVEEADDLSEEYDDEAVEYVDAEEDIEDNVDQNTESKKMDKVITILGIAIGVVIIVIATIVIVKMVKLFSGNKGGSTNNPTQQETTVEEGKVVVPNVLGMTFEEAKAELAKCNLGISSTEDYSELQPEGKIFRQGFDAGAQVDEHTTITVVISKGTASFDMPNFVGYSKSDLEEAVEQYGLRASYKYEETDKDNLVDTVKDTNPEAGTKVTTGSTIVVTLYIKKADVKAVVPNVVGKTEAEAVKLLESKGFKNIERQYASSDSVPKGSVISQSGPEVNKEASVSTAIIIVISQGSKQVVIENVIGKGTEDAKTILKNAGLTNVTMREEYNSAAYGTVYAIEGANIGDKVGTGTAIVLVISKGDAITATVNKADISAAVTIDDNTEVKLTFKYKYTLTDGEYTTPQVCAAPQKKYGEIADTLDVDVFECKDKAPNKAVSPEVIVIITDAANGTELGTVTLPASFK